jgi:hypothetical protein
MSKEFLPHIILHVESELDFSRRFYGQLAVSNLLQPLRVSVNQGTGIISTRFPENHPNPKDEIERLLRYKASRDLVYFHVPNWKVANTFLESYQPLTVIAHQTNPDDTQIKTLEQLAKQPLIYIAQNQHEINLTSPGHTKTTKGYFLLDPQETITQLKQNMDWMKSNHHQF